MVKLQQMFTAWVKSFFNPGNNVHKYLSQIFFLNPGALNLKQDLGMPSLLFLLDFVLFCLPYIFLITVYNKIHAHMHSYQSKILLMKSSTCNNIGNLFLFLKNGSLTFKNFPKQKFEQEIISIFHIFHITAKLNHLSFYSSQANF